MSTHQSPKSSEAVTITTLRQHAAEMLRVADHLEAAQRLTNRSQVAARPMSHGRRRAVAKKGPTIVGVKKAA